MPTRRSIAVAVSLLAPFALARCDCADPLQGLPAPQIEILDDAGNSHKKADPWLVVDFGDADSGQTQTRNVSLKDIGTGPLTVTSVCLVNAPDLATAKTAPCIIGQNAPFTFDPAVATANPIKVGAQVDMAIRFAPLTGGPAAFFLQVTSDAVDEPVVAVQLIARGTDGRLCAEPSGLFDFGDVPVGATVPGQLTVRNCGVKPVTLTSFDFSQNPDTAFTFVAQGAALAGRTLAENEAVVLDLTFTPAQPGPYRDTRAGDIHIVTGAPFEAEYDLILVGNGVVPPACRVHVVPQVLQFNSVASGTSSTRQIIVQSVGQCGCTVDSIVGPTPDTAGFAFGALPALPFTLKGTVGCDGDPAGAATAPSSVNIDVTYTSPVRDVPVTDTATVDIGVSDELAPLQTVNLEANGGGAPFCQLEVTPVQVTGGFSLPATGRWGVVEFGRTSVNVPKRLPIGIKNIGNANCSVNSVAYDLDANTRANEFSLETDAGAPATGIAAFTVQPGDTRTFFAVFSPTHTIESNGIFPSFGGYSPNNAPADASALERGLLCGGAINGPNNKCNGVTFTTTDNTTVDPDLGAPNAAGLAYSIGFSGTPVAPSVDVIPGQLDFGLVTLDCGSPTQRVSVYNNGGADLIVDEPVIDPAVTPEVFRVEGTTNFNNTWPFTIPAGGSMSIEVRYFARQLGLQTANLLIPTVDGGQAGPPVSVPLQGTGTTDTSQTDTFDQFGDPKVDVLWVVDDSGSMAPYQDEMASNFSQFFIASNVQGADFHIAVTTSLTAKANCVPDLPTCSTDADCGVGGQCLATLCTAGTQVNSCDDDPMSGYWTSCSNEHFLTPVSPNVDSQFQCNVHTANGASNPSRPASDSAEGGFRAAYKFLSPPNITDPAINGGFMRDDAKLHVIMVSDEPEQSKGSVDEYIDFFKNLKGFRNSSLVAVSAIAAPASGCSLADGTAVGGDARYPTLVDELNGRFESICNPDWTSMMSQLGLDSLGLRVEFFLSRAAEEASIQVCVKSTPAASCVAQTKTSDGAANGWFFDGVDNSVVFNAGSVPPRGSQVVVTYGTFCFEP